MCNSGSPGPSTVGRISDIRAPHHKTVKLERCRRPEAVRRRVRIQGVVSNSLVCHNSGRVSMSVLWKPLVIVAVACTIVGFVSGMVGTRFANYYLTSGPSFPESPHSWLRFLGYPGLLIAGRTGPHGFNDFARSYNWVAVAVWNAGTWAILLPMFLWIVVQVSRCFQSR